MWAPEERLVVLAFKLCKSGLKSCRSCCCILIRSSSVLTPVSLNFLENLRTCASLEVRQRQGAAVLVSGLLFLTAQLRQMLLLVVTNSYCSSSVSLIPRQGCSLGGKIGNIDIRDIADLKHTNNLRQVINLSSAKTTQRKLKLKPIQLFISLYIYVYTGWPAAERPVQALALCWQSCQLILHSCRACDARQWRGWHRVRVSGPQVKSVFVCFMWHFQLCIVKHLLPDLLALYITGTVAKQCTFQTIC